MNRGRTFVVVTADAEKNGSDCYRIVFGNYNKIYYTGHRVAAPPVRIIDEKRFGSETV